MDLIAKGYPTANDHWAVTTRAATTAILDVVVEDPAVGDDDEGGDEPPPDSDRAFQWDDPEERVLQAYYQVVGDIEKYGAQRGFFVPSPASAIVEARGIRLPGSRYWIGAATPLFEARAKGKLRELLKTGDALPGEDIVTDTTIVGGNGLIFARLK